MSKSIVTQSTEFNPEKETGVYLIRNTVNQKYYVGSTERSFGSRFRGHITRSKKQESNPKFQSSWNKYGANAFQFEILEICETKDCISYEQAWMKSLNPILNIAQIAGNTRGYKHTEEYKKRSSESRMGKPSGAKGKKRTEETRKRLSEAHQGPRPWRKGVKTGKTPWNKGKRMSDDIKAKCSLTHKGKMHTEAWKIAMSKRNKGHKSYSCGLPVKCVETNMVYKSRKEAAIANNGGKGGLISKSIKCGSSAYGLHWIDFTDVIEADLIFRPLPLLNGIESLYL